MKVRSESEVAQSCPTLSNPMDCSPPGSSVHGSTGVGWGTIAFSYIHVMHSLLVLFLGRTLANRDSEYSLMPKVCTPWET